MRVTVRAAGEFSQCQDAIARLPVLMGARYKEEFVCKQDYLTADDREFVKQDAGKRIGSVS